MRIRETHLRRVIRDELRMGQLHEDAVATGGNLSGYTDPERQQIAKKVQVALQKKLVGSGALKAGDEWSLTVNIGKRSVGVGKKSGAATGLRNNEIKPALKAIADDSNILDRDKLRAGRRLKISVSDTVARAVEVPDQSAPSVDRPRTPRKYDRTDCVKKQQVALGVTDDGFWGPKTQDAWEAKYPGTVPPSPRDGSNLPACKKEDPDTDEEECPEGEHWPGPPMAPPPDGCVPDEDEDPDIDKGPTEKCKKKGKEILSFMEGADNPLLNPGFYAAVTNDSGLMNQFAEFWEQPAFASEMKETLRLIEKVAKCDCIGPSGHTAAAKALVLQIRTNSDNFGDAFNPLQLFFRILKVGVHKFYDLLASIWNGWEFTNWLTGKDLPRVETLTWSRAGMTGWVPGFDPLSRAESGKLIELAAELDALDICGEDGEEYEGETEDDEYYGGDDDSEEEEEGGGSFGGGSSGGGGAGSSW